MKHWLERHGIYGWTNRHRLFLHLRSHTFRIEGGRMRGSFWWLWKWGGQEEFVQLSFGAYWGVWLAWETPFSWHRIIPWDGKYQEIQREIGVHWHHGILWISRGGEFFDGHKWTFHIEDWVLGRPQFSKEVLEEGIPVTVNVGQWEGDTYTGTAKREHCRWQRRFKTIERDDVWIEMFPHGIPFPGKGENSWDCGDDAYYGFGGDNIESAVGRIIESTKLQRFKYGGPRWRPESITPSGKLQGT